MPKLTYKNNWEAHEYYVDGKLAKEILSISIAGEKLKVKSSKVTVPYNDMGNQYNATSTQFYVEAKVFGAKMNVALDDLLEKKVKIEVLKWVV